MRRIAPLAAACLALAACHKGGGQAAALDRAADQSDPAGAAVLRNAADDIRANGSDANLSAPGSPTQSALSNAGAATADTVGPRPPSPEAEARGAATNGPKAPPHQAGEPVPQPGKQ